MMSFIYTMDIAQVEFVTLVGVSLLLSDFYYYYYYYYIMLCISQLKTIVSFQVALGTAARI